jgi:hypothetical protein
LPTFGLTPRVGCKIATLSEYRAGPNVRHAAISRLSTLTDHREFAVAASPCYCVQSALPAQRSGAPGQGRLGATLMAFEVGQSYERLKDGKRAIVAYARPAAALLRLDVGKQEWITSADLRRWRRYERCPVCRGKGFVATSHSGRDETRPELPVCSACGGRGRIYL